MISTKGLKAVVAAFNNQKSKRFGSFYTNGISLWLWYNMERLAQYREDGLYISIGDSLDEDVKIKMLNQINGVEVSRNKGVFLLNGENWDGKWIKVKQ